MYMELGISVTNIETSKEETVFLSKIRNLES